VAGIYIKAHHVMIDWHDLLALLPLAVIGIAGIVVSLIRWRRRGK
jgi:hypothetical protein